jgi:hypothetical protein
MTTIYGQTQKQQDETLCKTQNLFSLRFSGRGSINTSGSVTFRLKRENGHQAFYLPEQTAMLVRLRCCVSNSTDAYANSTNTATDTLDGITGDYFIFRDLSGNVTVTIDPATPATEAVATVVPTANTTIQGFEILVSALDAALTNAIVFAELDCFCVHEPTNLANFPAGATAALTVAG